MVRVKNSFSITGGIFQPFQTNSFCKCKLLMTACKPLAPQIVDADEVLYALKHSLEVHEQAITFEISCPVKKPANFYSKLLRRAGFNSKKIHFQIMPKKFYALWQTWKARLGTCNHIYGWLRPSWLIQRNKIRSFSDIFLTLFFDSFFDPNLVYACKVLNVYRITLWMTGICLNFYLGNTISFPLPWIWFQVWLLEEKKNEKLRVDSPLWWLCTSMRLCKSM